MGVLVIVIAVIILFLTLIYFDKTKIESELYINKSRQIARIVILLKTINLILFEITDKIEGFAIGEFIGLFLAYAVYKGQLRIGQVLSERKNLIGSSILKGSFSWKNIDWRLIIKINLIFIIWSFLIFSIWKPRINPNLINDISNISSIEYILDIINTIIAVVFLAPITEELTFRFMTINVFLQWFGKKNKISIFFAILIPTLMWVFLHSSVMVNYWVKYIQILPVGLIFGYIMYKKDIEHSILLHMISNATILIVSLILF
ncbi:CPBP family intramembrane glutamic endopeptidase [Maledivibacter halophilus]|uniref:CAAX protease self-immunity n=1 Tax=Maledivibacter halophilus TaxID=36842 RepID=A0A1T5L851_9FIRM|nr:CPBP family intramembrane glutamic endopeptidase [Maledivibacter halophilus]SKC72123.1 CAAX protease self-immunity [Maledivibacter halophilus]